MMKVSIELPEIDGFEYTGEYRKPTTGEWFLNVEHEPMESIYDRGSPYPILKKKAVEYFIKVWMGNKFVEMDALEDALALVDSHYNWSGKSKKKIAALKELL